VTQTCPAPNPSQRRGWSVGGVFEYSSRVTPQRLVLLFVAINFLFLAGDVFLAHGYNRLYFRLAYEWIPVIASPAAGMAALWLALRNCPRWTCVTTHLLGMAMMFLVGVVGFVMHLLSAMGVTQQLTWPGLVFAAPVIAPLSFAGVALVGIVAAAREDPGRLGRLQLLGGRLVAPFSQQQHLHLLNGLGLLGATLLAVIDHSQGDWTNILVWTPVVGGFFLTGLTLHHAALRQPRPIEKLVYFWAMMLAILIGLTGFAAHVWHDLAGTGQFSLERLLKDAPPFAPLLFANMGLLGLLALIEPGEEFLEKADGNSSPRPGSS